jgi:putative transposase
VGEQRIRAALPARRVTCFSFPVSHSTAQAVGSAARTALSSAPRRRQAQRQITHDLAARVLIGDMLCGVPMYRRAFVPGGTFFFTVVTEGRAEFLCEPLGRDCLRTAVRECRERWPFVIEAFVLLPDHLHTLWSLPPADADYSRRWAFLKKQFTKMWLDGGGAEQSRSESRQRNRRRGVWQRRFWEHVIRDDHDLRRHLDYIHYNPVKHARVSCPHFWPYSTFHRWVQREAYANDWGCVCGQEPIQLRFDDLGETAME